jgi:hypothetical protein
MIFRVRLEITVIKVVTFNFNLSSQAARRYLVGLRRLLQHEVAENPF